MYLYASLCHLLDRELERQENVLAVLDAQNEALRRRDVLALDAHTSALAALTAETIHAERARFDLMTEIAKKHGLSPQATLRQLTQSAPEVLRDRLMWYRDRLKQVIHQISCAARINNMLLRAGLKTADRIFREFSWQDAAGSGYTGTGRESPALCAASGYLDQKG